MSDEDLEPRVRRLEDRLEIEELTARYCHAVARADSASIVAMFTEDGVFEMGPRQVRGRHELERFYGDVSTSPPIPFIQNHVIEVTGDEATGTCSVEIRLVQEGEAYTAAGWYEDSYRRVEGSWRFAQRVFHVFHWVPLKKGWSRDER